MPALSITPPFPVFTDKNGIPLEDGYFYIGVANLEPVTNPINVYWDNILTTSAVQPIRTLAGYPSYYGTPSRIYTGEIAYSIKVFDKNGNIVFSSPFNTGPDVLVDFAVSEEVQVATAGQTVFNLTNSYSPGTNSLTVYVDGVNQYDGSSYSYQETNGTTVTFNQGLHVGALVKFTTAIQLSGGANDAAQISYYPAGAGAVVTNVQEKLRQTVSVKDFGAVGDGIAIDTAAINTAMNAAAAAGKDLYFPSGVYLIDATLTIPVTSTYARFAIRGEYETDIANTSNLPGAVIRTNGNFTAIQTPVLTPPNNTIAYWTKAFEISDIYVSGPQNEASAYSTSVGFNLSGVQFLKAHNLHAEGFGTGLYIENGSEIYLSGRHVYQNNYYGAFLKRSNVNTTDLQVWAQNLVCVNNYVPLVLRTVRSFWCNNGEFITYGASPPLTGRTPMSRVYVENSYDTQIHFDNITMENDENVPMILIDSDGVGTLTIKQGNFQSAILPLVKIEGEFDSITIENCMFDIDYTGVKNAAVWLANTNATATELRANVVNMSGHTPMWLSYAVRDDSASRSPYGDHVPAYMQQINPRREMDQADDNHITIYGNYNFTTSNVLVGNARLYWDDNTVANNFAILVPSRSLKGAKLLWLTFIADTDSNATVPYVYSVGGIGNSPADWQQVFSCILGSYTVGAKTFYKWGIAVEILNNATSKSTGVISIGLANIYSTASGTSSGLEYFSLYADQGNVGNVQFTDRLRSAVPSTGLEGYGAVTDKIYNSAPSSGNLGWVCTVAGIPGTWVTFG